MIPILYHGGESTFETNGLGRLSDCISCVVTEERNGIYECEFEYPVLGVHFKDIQIGRIISCTHDNTGGRQPFVVYRKSEPINGVVTYNAHHVSYRLNHSIVKPFSAISAITALQAIPNNLLTDCGFTFWTDINQAGTVQINTPRSVRDLLGGADESILSHFHGEYEFDEFTVKLHEARGSDRGVSIRYGKNLISYKRTISDEGMYSAIIPYWYNPETETAIYGDLIIASSVPMAYDIWTCDDDEPMYDDDGDIFEFVYPNVVPVAYDFTDRFESMPTVAELNAQARSFLSNNRPYLSDENYVVDFAQLWQSEEYAAYAPLQDVNLCDTVTIVYPDLGVNAKVKVIKTVYDCLLDRYKSVELGSPARNYAEILLENVRTLIDLSINKSGNRSYNAMVQAINDATAQLTGQNGGSHIVFTRNIDGGLEEMFIMDTNDPDTAVNVWRYNSAGWGHSSSGKNGPYTLAATQQGTILADFITAGVLQGYSDNNYWDLTNGRLVAEYGKIAVFSIGSSGLSFIDNFLSNTYYTASIGLQNMYYGEETWYGNPGSPGSRLKKYTHAIIYGQGFGIQTYNELIDSSAVLAIGIESFQNSDSDGFKIYGSTNDSVLEFWAAEGTAYSYVDWDFRGSLNVWGTKHRKLNTRDYSDRVLYSYETTSPMFGDIGEGEIGSDGNCRIWFDPVFLEIINTDSTYQVFLQAYGEGNCYVSERTGSFFEVTGTPGLIFGWEVKARQLEYESVRLANSRERYTVSQKNYGAIAEEHLKEIMKERGLSE